jgi:transcriptional regulator GlxA family with amidase domain
MPPPPYTITVLALPGCLASAVFGLEDVFAIANRVARLVLGRPRDLFRCELRSMDGRPVCSSEGRIVAVDGIARATPKSAYVVVPGALLDPGDLDELLDLHATGARWLRRRHEQGHTIAATCSGVLLLGSAGLLDERTATTTWWLQPELVRRFPTARLAPNAMLTDDDGIICAAGPMSHVDLGVYLVERLGGRELATLVSRYGVIERGKRAQSAYVAPTVQKRMSPFVEQAHAAVVARLPRPPRVPALAKTLGVSTRTLHRRLHELLGVSPREFITQVKIDRARELLETSDRGISEMSPAVGFGDESTFRRAVRRRLGHSPREYRRLFGLTSG